MRRLFGISTVTLLFAACQLSSVGQSEQNHKTASGGGEHGHPHDDPPPPPVDDGGETDPDPDPDPPPDDPPVPDLRCEDGSGGAALLDAEDRQVASYGSVDECEQVVEAAGEGVVCAYFTPGMPIGPGGWDETGWRAMNIATGIGLGRRPHTSFQNCLDATRNARGGVVCTNTGVGYKSAHIETNMWCGASSNLPWCLVASAAAKGFHVCSFPSDGDGSGPGWVLTEIAGTQCNYMTSSMPLTDCNAMVPDGP